MAAQDPGGQQQRTPQRAHDVEDASTPESTEELKDRQDALADDVDSILDDIDEVLEENAEDFVRGFVQKGGQ